MDSFHLDITSFDSKEDFPGNTGNNFRVKLSEPLALSGNQLGISFDFADFVSSRP